MLGSRSTSVIISNFLCHGGTERRWVFLHFALRKSTAEEGMVLRVYKVATSIKIARVDQLRFQWDFSGAIYHRGLRCNSRNTVTLSSSLAFEQTHIFCLRNRRALTFCADKLHENRDEIDKIALSCATNIACVNGLLNRMFVCH